MITILRTLSRPSRRSVLAGLFSLVPLSGAFAAISSEGAGEVAIYREAGGADVISPNGSTANGFLTHDFDTNEREDGGSFTRVGADVTLNRTGHYLAIYNSRFDATPETSTEQRVEVQSYLTVNGTALPSGWSQGYIRRQNTQWETITAGMAVFEANANDVLQLRSFRTDNTTAGTVTRFPDGTGLQLIKLDDVNMDYARLSLATNQSGPVDANWVKVAYDTPDQLGAGFSHGTPGDLTLLDGGKYLVLANTYIGPSSNRSSMVQRLTLDGVEVPGSKTTIYMRNAQNANQGAASVGMILDATPGQTLRVEGSLDIDLTGLNYRGERCALSVIHLPSLSAGTAEADPEYLLLNTTGDQNINTTNDTPLVFSNQTQVDASFGHTSGGSEVSIVVPGDYLFLSSVYDDDDDVQRGFYSQGWSVNGGSRSAVGQSGRYSRHSFGADQFGNSSAFIGNNLAAFDTIEMVSSGLGNPGTNNANQIFLQGVRLASLFTYPAAYEVLVDPLALSVVEGGSAETYAIELGRSPDSGSVEVTITPDSQTEVSIDGGTNFFPSATLTFTTGGVAQTVTVRAVDDSDIESAHLSVITHAITTTGDPTNYPTTLVLPDVNLSLVDNDVVAVAAGDDTSTSNASENALGDQSLLAPATSLLDNDSDGFENEVVAFDSVSEKGALVTVETDGTFTYDPRTAALLQALPAGGSTVDTFDYTVRDGDGNTSVGTVSITVEGANDPVTAADDNWGEGPFENGTFTNNRSLVANDGIVGARGVQTFPAGSDLRTLPGMTTSQSPSVGAPPGGGVPENAFDGNAGTFTHTQSNNNTVDHVWQVDFGQDVSLEEVTLTNRQDCCADRLRDITVTVLDGSGAEIFNSGLLNPANVLGFTGNSGGTLYVDFTGPITGRTLVVTRNPDLSDPNASNGSILSLGEVTVIGSAPGTYYETDGRLLLDYDAGRLSGNGRWENKGARGGTAMDWVLTDVTLDPAPGTFRAGITAAYEWDDLADDATPASGTSGSIHDHVAPADRADATWEFWVKPANTNSVMTIFETGGGSGFGCIINNGVLEAATELDGASQTGSYVSYDLVADPLGLVGNDPTNEFNQYAVTLTINGGLQLYVNGVLVDESTSGVSGDWDGGDGAGLGGFGETNHGGFTNGAAGTAYDATFLGQMAIVRLYSGVLSGAEIQQNYKAVDAGTDIDGEAIAVVGVIDGGGNFVANGSQATLASGALVTMTDSAGGFDYDPNGVFDLINGETVTDTFTYRVSDGIGSVSEAEVAVTITGEADAGNDRVLAKEGQVVTYTPNEFLGNDERPVTPGAYLELTPPGIVGGSWTNTGSAQGTHNGTVLGSVIAAPDLTSGFYGIGAAATSATFEDCDAISTGSATIEVWFKPDPGQTGKLTVFETGGNGNGFSIVFDADTNEVIANFDGGDDTNNSMVVASGPGSVSTSEFNQIIVLLRPNEGPETSVGSGIFVDLMDIRVNNDPLGTFDGAPDATTENLLGTSNDWCGTDNSGLNFVSGTAALNENFPAALGTVAIARVYPFVLTPSEMEVNFDSVIDSLAFVASPTTEQGATVTLNVDGTVSVNYSGVSLAPGTTTTDSFTYLGNAGLATVNVTIEALTPQEAWRLAFYGTIANAGLAEDSAVAVNGLTNLQNFALALDPTNGAATLDVDAEAGTILSVGPPAVWVDPADGRIYLRHTRRADLAALSLSITEQFSRDLVDFEDSQQAPLVIATGTGVGGAAIEAVQTEFPLVLPVSGGKGRFGRVEVSNP